MKIKIGKRLARAALCRTFGAVGGVLIAEKVATLTTTYDCPRYAADPEHHDSNPRRASYFNCGTCRCGLQLRWTDH
jgi:hypothetical protein